MKKLLITSLSALALAMAFTGCGDSGSVTSASGSSEGIVVESNVVVSPVVDAQESAVTTPKTPFNLSEKVGTPPGLPN